MIWVSERSQQLSNLKGDRYKTNDLMFNSLESFVMTDKTWKVQLP
ncbi:MAG: hypothetical protein QS721_06665 [Candidatus Endonucleobacter sp. (ex Gigantidas childressi)]|nr:hypothetical protein [Candidatus Endonucleobacter sp. (ex Gigantidas childressi)]